MTDDELDDLPPWPMVAVPETDALRAWLREDAALWREPPDLTTLKRVGDPEELRKQHLLFDYSRSLLTMADEQWTDEHHRLQELDKAELLSLLGTLRFAGLP